MERPMEQPRCMQGEALTVLCMLGALLPGVAKS